MSSLEIGTSTGKSGEPSNSMNDIGNNIEMIDDTPSLNVNNSL